MPLTSVVAVTFAGWFAGARGEEPLHAAASSGNVIHAHLALLRCPDAVNAPRRIGKGHYPSPVHLAAQWGHTGVLKLLIARGGNMNSAGEAGYTPLQFAALHAARSGSRECPELLLDSGAALDIFSAVALDKWPEAQAAFRAARAVGAERWLANASLPLNWGRWRLLNWAVEGGHRRMVELLLDHGAEVNPQRSPYPWPERPPLHGAVSARRHDLAALLLDRGAAIDAQDYDGYTALHRAVLYGDAAGARFLLERGASTRTRLDFYAPRISHPNGDPRTFFTPVHTAARRGSPELVALLLTHGADPNARAAVPRPQGIVTAEQQEELATPAARAARGRTPLDVAEEVPDEWDSHTFGWVPGTRTGGRVLCEFLLRVAGGRHGAPVKPDAAVP